MNRFIAVGATVALLVGGALAADELKSGPQVGATNITPFNPLHCNGADTGKKLCLV
jgi:hypothetical protein